MLQRHVGRGGWRLKAEEACSIKPIADAAAAAAANAVGIATAAASPLANCFARRTAALPHLENPRKQTLQLQGSYVHLRHTSHVTRHTIRITLVAEAIDGVTIGTGSEQLTRALDTSELRRMGRIRLRGVRGGSSGRVPA